MDPDAGDANVTTATVHYLKTWPEFFQAVWSGDKTCEVRKNDRSFVVGDVLMLQEWCPVREAYLGRVVSVRVSHVLREPWAPAGHVVMSFYPVPRLPLDLRRESSSEPAITNDDTLVLREWKKDRGSIGEHDTHVVTDDVLLRLIADCRANGRDLREEYDRHVRDTERQLAAHREAADAVLRDFGDEYPGRLAPLRDLVGDD